MIALRNRLSLYSKISNEAWAPMDGLKSRQIFVQPGHEIIREGDPANQVFIIKTGWAMRYRMLEDGRRQIVNFMLPGDIFDLQALANLKADHTVCAISAGDVLAIDQNEFLQTLSREPLLASAFWWASVQEESILREHIVRVGRLSARERIGHMLLELQRRLTGAMGRIHDSIPFPLTRQIIADALGLTSVHVSRTMSKMRAAGLIREEADAIHIADHERLAVLSHFDPAYLHAIDPLILAVQQSEQLQKPAPKLT